MIWQDAVIGTVVMVFTLTTIPLIRSGVHLPLLTAVPMVVGSTLLVGCYLTLGIWLSAVIEVFAVLLWSFLLKRALAGR